MTLLCPKLNNYLWIGRTRLGLTRKRLAVLIGHETTCQLSRWEDGEQLPSLRNALMLGYLLERPVEELFERVREDVIRDVENRKRESDDADVLSVSNGAGTVASNRSIPVSRFTLKSHMTGNPVRKR